MFNSSFMRRRFSFHFLSFLLLLNWYTIAAQTGNEFIPCREMPAILQQFYADYTALNRIYTIEYAPEKRERYKIFAQDYERKLEAIPFNALSQGCKVDYLLFHRDLEDMKYQAGKEKVESEVLAQYFPFADSLYALEKIRRRGAVVNGQAIASMFNKITLEISQLKIKVVEDKILNVSASRTASGIIQGLQDAAKSVFTFYNGYDPLFTWWVPDTYHKLDSSLSDYATQFKHTADRNSSNKDSSGIIGQPIGRTEILRQLKNEFIPYSPEELIEIANKEFTWCDREMLKASAEMGFGKNWKQALEKVKDTYVPPGEQPAAMMKLYDESIAFLKAKDLVTIPPLADETWRMVMMSPKQQLLNPFFYGGEEFSISYPTNTMNYNDRMMSMRGNNPHFSRATVHHELIAGHYLQQFMCEHYNTYRHFDTPFWTEGWALYWEMTLWDKGFPQSAEDRVGMLFWRMHRCARIIFSLNYHLRKWTPQQCIDFLVDRVGHERANAEGEVRRSFVGGYSPLYQLAYMIGGLQFSALQKEMVGNGKMTMKEFHDAVLQQNALPVEMIRAIFTKQELTKEFETKWKFY
jgi:hypothetical protein